MPNYTDFMMRHGEFEVQSIIEQIERQEGISSNRDMPLEDRWEALMRQAPAQQQHLAA